MNTIEKMDVLDDFIRNNPISIYGAGRYARAFLGYAAKREAFVEQIFVTNRMSNPSEIFGIKVREISEISSEESKAIKLIICVSGNLREEILEEIKRYRINDVLCVDDELLRRIVFLSADIDEEFSMKTKQLLDEIDLRYERTLRFVVKPCLEYMIVNILDHCNLRCKGCDHFACIADEKFYHREDIYKDLKRMSKIFRGDYIMKIAVMGGEPLLHPELKQILADVRECFPHTIIRLTTNGLLLLQQDDDFWKVCRENDVMVVNTKYPLNLKYDEMQKKASEEGVKFQFFEGTGDGKIKHSFKKIINLKGDSNPAESFSRCHISNYGNILLDGKFYGCPFSIQSYRIFNKKFSQNLRMTEDDYIDIYKVDDKEEFFKFAARPKYYCRYCCGLSPEFPWERSKQKMSEWVETEM